MSDINDKASGVLGWDEDGALAAEAEQRWGQTKAFRQSRARTAKFTPADWQQVRDATDANLKALVALMLAGRTPDSPEVQAEIKKHHAGIGRFYDVTPEIYRGLADMYLADQRFADFYRKYHPDLPEFLAAGMRAYSKRGESRREVG